MVMRGKKLYPDIDDTDPQQTGLAPLPPTATDPRAKPTADIFRRWVEAAQDALSDQTKANGVTLRGFATDPDLPSFKDAYGLRAACVAVYPMYRGVSRLVGMDVVEFSGETPEDEFAAAAGVWSDNDFFFIHIKKTDSMGEDGNFTGKVKVIEQVDKALPELMALKPDVLIITGDHSTPSAMRYHSWHPVPLLLWAPETALPDRGTSFGERNCAQGGFGTMPALNIMPLALAHAGRLDKYGA
jgi:2,3-bisphosphoglycerate-independent phosphoglycerate mutase